MVSAINPLRNENEDLNKNQTPLYMICGDDYLEHFSVIFYLGLF